MSALKLMSLDRWRGLENKLWPYGLLIVLGVAVYSTALWQPPTEFDEFRYLTSVADTPNPLVYLIGDHGHGNNLYRPLTSISLWAVYQVFGVWALPNHLINLSLHIFAAGVLYSLIQQIRQDTFWAITAASLFLVSVYTRQTSTYTAERAMLLAGIAMLLLLKYLAQLISQPDTGEPLRVRVGYIVGLLTLGIFSKESILVGSLLVVAFAIFYRKRLSIANYAQLLIVAVATLLGLVLWRLIIFGSNALSYPADVYLLTFSLHVENSNDLPVLLQSALYLENILKNIVAVFLPIFGPNGGWLPRTSFLYTLPIMGFTGLLLVLTIVRKRLDQVQILALLVIVFNAVVHYFEFRYRLLYFAQAAYCVLVTSWPNDRQSFVSVRLEPLAKISAFLLVLFSVIWIVRVVDIDTTNAFLALGEWRLNPAQFVTSTQSEIASQIIDRYTFP